MSLEPEKIQREIDESLEALAQSRGDRLAGRIRSILMTNLDRGRVQVFIGGRAGLISAYVARVADRFTELNGLLHRLQVERSPEAWEPLFERMQTWAYNFFLRKGFSAGRGTQEIAVECAAEAALNLLPAHFPYDTDFDPWAHIIVQNACRKYIDRAFRKSAIPDNRIVELEDKLVGPDELLLEGQALQNELGSEVQAALAQLSEARRTVLQSLYFDELAPQEVARKMGKSLGAIYSLQFHALRDLRKILSTIRDSLNE